MTIFNHHIPAILHKTGMNVEATASFTGSDLGGKRYRYPILVSQRPEHPFCNDQLVGCILNICRHEFNRILLIDHVATGKIAKPEQTGKLLYENKNTDWVEQVAATSQNYQKRISGLIDFHIKNLRSKNTVAVEDRVEGFDIRDYAK